MKTIDRYIIVFFLSILSATSLWAQDRLVVIENKLKELAAKDIPGLNQKVDLSVNGTSVQEFIRGIASTNSLNVSIDPTINAKVVNNFTNVTVQDVLLFLCNKHSLDINFIGSIMSFVPYTEPVIVNKYVSKKINLSYDNNTGLITLDLNNDSLSMVVKELTKISKKNVVFIPELNGKLISGYIQSTPLEQALNKLALINDLSLSNTEDNFYVFGKKDKEPVVQKGENGKNQQGGKTQMPQGMTLKINPETKFISLDANNIDISAIISAVSAELGINYFLFSEIKGNTSLNIKDFSYEELLTYIFSGTEFTYKKEVDIYLFGERNIEGLRATKLVTLQYRTVDDVLTVVPDDLKKGISIKQFSDLNSFVLSGSLPRINEVEQFLRQIDRVVPNIAIEVMIADVRKSKNLSTGIEAGLGESRKTSGVLYPGLDLTIGSEAINSLISGLNGIGAVNLGNVTPKFYVTLKMLETQGVIKMRSTPQIATINGKEAKLSIGQTAYYLEQTTNTISNTSTQNVITQNYKAVNADLTLTIKPIVSGDNQITLDIEVKQSNFTERIAPTAPPGTITRNFKSAIRVKDGEMIMLGGLEENSTNITGSGIPLLSRIPVLKWLFSSRTRNKTDNKLTIFIKPTVLY